MEAEVAKIEGADDIRFFGGANKYVAPNGLNPPLLRGRKLCKIVRRSVGERLRINVEADRFLRFVELYPFTAEREGAAEVLAHYRWLARIEVAIDESHEAGILAGRLHRGGIRCIFVEGDGASCRHTKMVKR